MTTLTRFDYMEELSKRLDKERRDELRGLERMSDDELIKRMEKLEPTPPETEGKT